jgi:tetratricopeptide (TPR) repeat protein
MQTPNGFARFATLRRVGRIVGVALVVLGATAWRPWATAQPLAPAKGKSAAAEEPAAEAAKQPAAADKKATDQDDLLLDDLLDGQTEKGAPLEADAEKVQQDLAEGKALFDEKKYEEAIDKFNDAVKDSGKTSAEAFFYQGRTLLEMGAAAQAVQSLGLAISQAEVTPEAKAPKEYYYYRGRALNEAQDYQNAYADLSEAIRLDESKSYADAYHQRGITLRQSGQIKRAQKDLEKAIGLDASKKEYYTDLGVLFYIDKKPEKAVEALTKAIELTEAESPEGKTEEELEKGYPDPYVARGAVYIVLGKQAKSAEAARDAYEHAVDDSLKAVDIRPEEGSSYFNLGLAYRLLDRFEEAIAAFSKGLTYISPDSPTFLETYLRRGICWYYLNDFGMATTDFFVALGIDDQDARLHFWHGLSLARQGETADALQAYDRALALRPDYYDAHYNRGLANLELGEHKKAVNSFNFYIALRPEDPRGFFARGVAQAGLGDYQGALASYTRAVQLDPQNARAWFNRSLVRERLGQRAEAQRDRREALRLDPALDRAGATAQVR